jgi:hypothetical protein
VLKDTLFFWLKPKEFTSPSFYKNLKLEAFAVLLDSIIGFAVAFLSQKKPLSTATQWFLDLLILVEPGFNRVLSS